MSARMRNSRNKVVLLGALGLAACSGKASLGKDGLSLEAQRSQSISSGGEASEPAMPQHCDATDGRHEESSYDTSGDDVPDVRKVFLRVGEGDLARLVLVCRETDLNHDNIKDVVRYYTDDGQVLREEADRNFDGKMDEITYFQEAKIIRREFDTDGNGQVDSKVYYKDNEPLRAERDTAGRSSPAKWQPDRWEYFEEGRMVRMGSDIDGDGKVDRWDRDETLRAQKQKLRSDESVMEGEEGQDDAESGEEG